MPNTRIRDQWEPPVKRIVADNPKWGPRRILGELRNQAKTLGLSKDYPSERTIQRIKDDITPEEIVEYRTFYWPESMERGDLPWEASESALELLGFLDQQQSGARLRPPVRFARWFWRVSLAGHGVPIGNRLLQALALTVNEIRGGQDVSSVREVEWELAYRPWLNAAQMKAYRKAARRPHDPIPSGGMQLGRLESWNEPAFHVMIDWLVGGMNFMRAGVVIQAMLSDDVAGKGEKKEGTNG